MSVYDEIRKNNALHQAALKKADSERLIELQIASMSDVAKQKVAIPVPTLNIEQAKDARIAKWSSLKEFLQSKCAL